MRTAIPLKDIRRNLTNIYEKVAFEDERIVITKNGRKLFALVPICDLQTIEEIENKKDICEAKTVLEEANTNDVIDWKEVEKKLGI